MRIRPQFFCDDAQPEGVLPGARIAPRDTAFRQHQTFGEEPLQMQGVNVSPAAPAIISVRLGDILKPLAAAIQADRTFLHDFADDQLQLSADLLECLQVSEQIHRAA
jgi:hypothetical protein